MIVITWVILSLIIMSFFVYKLNVITQNICQYIQHHYPDEYAHCDQMSSQMDPEQKDIQIQLMESFHSGNVLLLQDPALEQLRQQLFRSKILFVLSPFLLMIVMTIVTSG
jgi:uncharacterized protein YxeA